LLVVAALLFGVCLGSNRALTDHEALLAGSAKQMVLEGDWLLLRIGDQPWLEKPPLPQWLAATCALAFGQFHEWTMRLPFACAGVLVVLIITRLMTTLFGREVGLLAGFVQATGVYQVAYARLAESDVMLQVFVLGAITVFQELETRRHQLSAVQQSRLRLAFWILLGFTNLAKGLAFGAVLTLLTCGGWLLLRRDWGAWRRWWSPLGMLLAILIASAWPVAVAVRDPEAVRLWLSHTVGRAAGEIGYTKPFWYYLTTWPSQLLPWTPILWIAVPASMRRAWRFPEGPDRFVWWWALCQPAVLSLSSGKHHHYLIYALPALSAVIAQGLLMLRDSLQDPQRSQLGWQWTLRALAAASVIGGFAVAGSQPDQRMDGLCLGALFGVGFGLLSVAYGRRDVRLTTVTLCSTVLAGHIYAQAVVMPRRDPSAADKQFLVEVERLVDPQAPLVASGCQEIARHIFYVQRPVIGVWNPLEIGAHLPPSPECYVIARGYAKAELETYGKVEQVSQSSYTRRERNEQDRYTLFRITPAPEIAAKGDDERSWKLTSTRTIDETAHRSGLAPPGWTRGHDRDDAP